MNTVGDDPALIPSSEQDGVCNVYELIAEDFAQTRGARPWPWVADFLDTLTPDSLVLDIGCGSGHNMMHDQLRFIGIENCNKFVDICKAQGLDVRIADMGSHLPVENSSIDAVILIAAFHHLSTVARRKQCLREIRRVIKPGGIILLSVWSHDQHHNRKLSFVLGENSVPWKSRERKIQGYRYYYVFDKDELRELITGEGFQIVSWDWIHGNEILRLGLA